ncbi:fluoride efflux transporter CrcB [Blastococcus sp. SYSU DS1024]
MAYLLAALGGALGALGRWGLAEAFPHSPAGLPWATLGVNVTGCLILGALAAVLVARAPGSLWARPFLGVGVLGGFTTYSTFAVEVVRLVEAGAVGTALSYVALSVLGGITAAAAGTLAGRALAGAPR